VFTAEERDRVRDRLFEIARADHRITGGATTGSRSVGTEDRWSDVDTAFGVADGVSLDQVHDDWTQLVEREFDVVHRFDLRHGHSVYRVFLLSNGLEVDVSLTPAEQFGARGPNFRLEFGEGPERTPTAAPDADELIGWGWIYVLNAHAAIERGRPWQAERWISATRDQGLALACLRHGLPTAHGRGFHGLDPDVTRPWEAGLVRSLDPDELRRALRVAATAFMREVAEANSDLAERLREPLSVAAPG